MIVVLDPPVAMLFARKPRRVQMSGVPTGRMLLVSPHIDDAALSCAALLARSEPIDLLTVFAGKPDPPIQGSWDDLTGFASSADGIPVRMAEDKDAFAGSAHRLTTLPLLEHQYVHKGRVPDDAAVIASAVQSWLDKGGGWVAMPAGAGRHVGRLRRRIERALRIDRGPDPHPDHTFVRDTVLGVVRGRGDVSVLAYEELPYRWGGKPDRRLRRIALLAGRDVLSTTFPIDRAAKAARIRAYRSQVPHLTVKGRRLNEPLSLPQHERYWLLPLRTPSGDE